MIHQSVTQARAGFSGLLERVQKEPTLIISKSKPKAVVISVEFFEELYRLKIEKETQNENLRRFRELEATLPVREATPEEEEAILRGEEEIKQGKCKNMSVDEIMDAIS